MRSKTRIILCSIVMLAGVPLAHGGVLRADLDAIAAPDPLSLSITLNERGAEGLSTSVPTAPLATSPEGTGAPERKVLQLPAPPSSATLFLSAMLSVGAYRFVKQAKWTHLGALPEWYHAEAPAQVGYTFLCDLQFMPIAACLFDEPIALKPVAIQRPELVPRGRDTGLQTALPLRAPRAPPVLRHVA